MNLNTEIVDPLNSDNKTTASENDDDGDDIIK